MILYEVRLEKQEPWVFDNAEDAFRNAFAFLGTKTRVVLLRKTYDDGVRIGTTRLSVAKFRDLFHRLIGLCKGYEYVKATHVRKCCGSEDESDWGDPMRKSGAIACLAATLAEFEPTSELTIDDYGYVPHFYDVFHVMRVYATNELVGKWDLVYETPQADPKPHVMDW